MALERCIAHRRSVRDFRQQPLTREQLGQLLWAAQGASDTGGRRSVPSAGALYPLEICVAVRSVEAVPAAIYRYFAESHEIMWAAASCEQERLVHAAGQQEWMSTAPAVICIAAVFARTTAKYGDRGRRYVYIEAGHAAENLMLQAISLGLATTMVGAFSDLEVNQLFGLGDEETALCLIPVGSP